MKLRQRVVAAGVTTLEPFQSMQRSAQAWSDAARPSSRYQSVAAALGRFERLAANMMDGRSAAEAPRSSARRAKAANMTISPLGWVVQREAGLSTGREL
jgi:hypothetical protein